MWYSTVVDGEGIRFGDSGLIQGQWWTCEATGWFLLAWRAGRCMGSIAGDDRTRKGRNVGLESLLLVEAFEVDE